MGWSWQNEPSDPSQHGWYAVVLCWDAGEGLFPGAEEWTGKWSTRAVSASAGPFASKAEALEWAYQHDPEDAVV